MKLFMIALGFVLCAAAGNADAEPVSYRLSTHILDVSRGIPAPGVDVELFKFNPESGEWTPEASAVTGENGRIGEFVPAGPDDNGIYKLKFNTAPYFKAQNQSSVYPYIEVVFKMDGEGHYHIPVTVSANGYATYKGN